MILLTVCVGGWRRVVGRRVTGGGSGGGVGGGSGGGDGASQIKSNTPLKHIV